MPCLPNLILQTLFRTQIIRIQVNLCLPDTDNLTCARENVQTPDQTSGMSPIGDLNIQFESAMVKYIDNYTLYEIIGSGVYGKVYRAVNNTDKLEYAIKVIPILKFRENKKLQECTVNEINILSNLESHPHIIRYFDMLKTTNNFYFIYEYCNGGTLQGLLGRNKKLPEPQALLIFRQILDAFQILNKYNIMHRDLKPDNIFFHNGVIKLGDFGFCKNLNSAQDMAKTMLGSPIYMAPEVLKGEIYSNKADIWSLGVVLYEMLFGFCPFQSNSIANLIEVLNTKNLVFPSTLSPLIRNLISCMLTKDPIQRIGWMEIFQIKISSEGCVQQSQAQNKIHSLNEAKTSEQPSSLSSGGKVLSIANGKLSQNTNGNDEGSHSNKNFKKPINRNTLTVQQKQESKVDDSNSVGVQHQKIVEAIKLSLQISRSKMSNSLGYTFLLLSKAAESAQELSQKCGKKKYSEILQKQARQIRLQKDVISNKMFPYELKGLDDWRKYLRGKFFEDQKTISLWYKMVMYLNCSKLQTNLNYKSMTESIKSILY